MGFFRHESGRDYTRAQGSHMFTSMSAVVVALAATLFYGAWMGLNTHAQEEGGVEPAAADSTVVLVLPYQGALLDPATGSARPDGDYSMTFRLYTAQTGGSAIWTETKNVVVNDGIFLTYLGSTTALNLNHFNGQNLWLGVTVGSDDEATPRMRLGFVGHAFWAENARNATNATNAVNATNATNATNAANATNAENAANAAALGGQAPAAFAPASHNHDGRYYTKAEADDRYLAKSSIYAFSENSSNDPVLRVENLGTHDGIFAVTASTIAGRAGVQGRAVAVGPIINSVAGVFGSSATYRGVIGSSTDSDGMLGFSTNSNGVYGQSINGVGVRAFSQFGNALQVDGPAVINGNLSVRGVNAPIAYGFINSAGTKVSGSANVSSSWNSTLGRFEITIAGEAYFWTSYVTLVTPAGCNNVTFGTGSVSNTLLVDFFNPGNSNKVQCAFQFVVYKP